MMMVAIVVRVKGKLWKRWKQGKISKKKFLETKKRFSRTAYHTKCKIEEKILKHYVVG